MNKSPSKKGSAEGLASITGGAKIHVVGGVPVMTDSDLAELYGVEVRALNQAVKRNEERFPPEFRFQFTPEDADILKSQSVISSANHGGRRSLPYVFTEQGVDDFGKKWFAFSRLETDAAGILERVGGGE